MAIELHNSGLRDDLDGDGLRIGIVQSRFNKHIGEGLLSSCRAQLEKAGVEVDDIEVFTVPGALETPFMLHEMALTNNYDGLIALGCIIRGDTYHFEVVANESARCISDIQLNTGVPIANAILTVDTEQQALERVIKGGEAAQVIIEMVQNLRLLIGTDED